VVLIGFLCVFFSPVFCYTYERPLDSSETISVGETAEAVLARVGPPATANRSSTPVLPDPFIPKGEGVRAAFCSLIATPFLFFSSLIF